MTTTATILSLVTALPPYRHRQMALYDYCAPYIQSPRAKAIYAAAEIESRYSVLPDASIFAQGAPGSKARNDLYMAAAQPLAAKAIGQALAGAGLSPSDIDHFILVSCTGFDNPGLEVSLAQALAMRPDLRRSALIGMGCYAGLTGLDRAMLEVTARPRSRILLLTLEFCTLHFQPGHQLDDMIAGALFGDGLAAVVVGASPAHRNGGLGLRDTMTFTAYEARDLIGFHFSDTGFQIRLATRLPKLLGRIVPGLVAEFLDRSGLAVADIAFWGIHPGGAKILDYVGQALALEPAALRFSRQVLKNYGNMSAVTIFFVLDEILRQGQPQPGDYLLLLSFGPGLTIELCLAQWSG
jgi:predicted naringenin-chalcone synthase